MSVVRVSSVVMSEFKSGECIRPRFGVRDTIDGEIYFDFLVITFCGAVCLGVIGCGKFGFDVEESEKFFEGVGCESGVAI